MTSDESAFQQAIAAAPDDDAPRLVYADWLDERGDSDKAAAVRLEGAYRFAPTPDRPVGLMFDPPPPLEPYPPLLRQLTDLGVPIDWLAPISRVGRAGRNLVEQFAGRVIGTRPDDPAPTPAAWAAAVADVQNMFAFHLDDAVVRERFAVPVDYALFAVGTGGLVCQDEYGMAFFDALYGPTRMASQTGSSCDMYADDNGPGEHLAACGLWLFVGFRDKHNFHLCCDRASPLFGMVVDQHDSHPWIEPPHGPTDSEVRPRSFLDFLHLQVVAAERDRLRNRSLAQPPSVP